MKSVCYSFVILASFATFFSVADAWRFNVGGNGAWVINPQENYKTWAERNRFQVNDTLCKFLFFVRVLNLEAFIVILTKNVSFFMQILSMRRDQILFNK